MGVPPSLRRKVINYSLTRLKAIGAGAAGLVGSGEKNYGTAGMRGDEPERGAIGIWRLPRRVPFAISFPHGAIVAPAKRVLSSEEGHFSKHARPGPEWPAAYYRVCVI